MRSSRRRALAAALLLAAAFAGGCGGRRAVGGDRAPTELETRYAAVRWAPADASWVVTCARTRDCVTAAHELAELAAIAFGMPSGALDAALRQRLGGSPLSLEDVAAAGLDLDRGAALVGQGGLPTVILPVRDAAALGAFLDRMRPERGAGLAQHRGHDVYSWTEGDGDKGIEVSWVALDGWFLVHLGPPPGGGGSLEWLDQVLAAPGGASLAGDPDLAAAARRGAGALGGGTPGLIAQIRLDRLARDLATWSGTSRSLVTCLERAAELAPQLVGAAQVSWDGASGWIAIDLPAKAAAALREHVAPPPPPGFVAYRREAAIAASLAVDLPFLERLRRAAGCPLWSEPVTDPVRAATGMAGPRAWHVAATDVDPDRLSGAGAVHLVLADRGLVSAQLESIPGRSLFERTRTVAGRKVRVLSLPGLPTILHHQEGDRFTGALGSEVMEAVLGPGDGAAAAADEIELASLSLAPGRLPNLPQLLRAVLGRTVGWTWAEAAAQLAGRLARYQSGALELSLAGDSLVLRARMGLRK